MIDGAGLARLLAQDLSARGGIDLLRGLSGRHVCAGQKRGRKIGPTKRGKGSKIMVLGDAEGLPLAVHLEAAGACRSEAAGAHPGSLCAGGALPLRLIADKAYAQRQAARATTARKGGDSSLAAPPRPQAAHLE